MTTVIRKGLFETNSSSTHSICVAVQEFEDLDIPKYLHLTPGEFGWEKRELRSATEKASYLFSGLTGSFPSKLQTFLDHLNILGVNFGDDLPDGSWGYVDHGDELAGFIDNVLSSPERLALYLFSPLSYIRTGNDNSDDFEDEIQIGEDYAHELFYKGN